VNRLSILFLFQFVVPSVVAGRRELPVEPNRPHIMSARFLEIPALALGDALGVEELPPFNQEESTTENEAA
jgi:hypothetical protein